MDGTLLKAWAGMKSFQRKGGKTPPYDPGNATVDRHGEKRSNQTPESKTAGITLSNVYFRLCAGPVKKAPVVDFLQALVRPLRLPLLLVWDRLPANAGKG
jgi:hypothetical protein